MLNLLKGFIIGIGKIIPGVSGSVLAITLGVYDKSVEYINNFKHNKKESLKLVKYILSGYFNGLSCDVYKNCYSEEEYQNRLRLVKKHISKGE